LSSIRITGADRSLKNFLAKNIACYYFVTLVEISMTIEEAHSKIIKAKSRLMISEQFYSAILARMSTVVLDQPVLMADGRVFETMATDFEKLYAYTEFVDSINLKELQVVLQHEAEHIAYGHGWRRKDRDIAVWNQAADHVINTGLEAAGKKLPDGPWCCDKRFAGMSSEEVYSILIQEPPSGDTKDMAGYAEPKPGKAAKLEKEWKRAVYQAAAASPPGSVPQHVKRMISEEQEPRAFLTDILRNFCTETGEADTRYPAIDRYYSQSSQFLLPGPYSEEPGDVVVCIDTSGSMDEAMLNHCFELIFGVLEEYDMELTVVDCDAEVNAFRKVTTEDMPISFKGGGGTRFAPAIEKVREQEYNVSVLIYLTDMYCNDFGPEPPFPVIWVDMNGKNDLYSQYKGDAPFGTVVEVDK
jgi:predicted metal-dependent peptidase